MVSALFPSRSVPRVFTAVSLRDVELRGENDTVTPPGRRPPVVGLCTSQCPGVADNGNGQRVQPVMERVRTEHEEAPTAVCCSDVTKQHPVMAARYIYGA